VAELAGALGCAEITVTAEMDRLGIRRRPQHARLSRGRQALAAKRADVRAAREARVRALGFDDLASYLRARHHQQRWPRDLIAHELGVPVGRHRAAHAPRGRTRGSRGEGCDSTLAA
jgi:hypothetical protein